MHLCILMTSILTGVMVSGMEMEDNCTMDRGLKCKSNTLLVPGSTYTVKSRCKNGKYPRKEKCSWRFNFHGCKPVISCDYIMTRKGKGKRCKGGDKLIMSSSVGWGFETVFCGKKKNTTVTPVHASDIAAEQDYLDIKFSANRKRKGKRGRGFQCQVTCEEPEEPSSDCRCGVANRVNKIAGANLADKNEFPWHVMLMITLPIFGEVRCGGSILSSKTILSAASCLDRAIAENVTVVVGEHDWTVEGDGEKRMNVCDIVIHPKYFTSLVKTYDIAILILCEDIIFTNEIAPVCPPSMPESDYANVPAIVTGWDKQAEKLKYYETNTMNNTKCNNDLIPTFAPVDSTTICASDHENESCLSVGGPLVTDEGGYYSQIGVMSPCGRPSLPKRYARVTSATRFIQDNIIGATCPPPKEV